MFESSRGNPKHRDSPQRPARRRRCRRELGARHPTWADGADYDKHTIGRWAPGPQHEPRDGPESQSAHSSWDRPRRGRVLRIPAVHGSAFELPPSWSRPECTDLNSGRPGGSLMRDGNVPAGHEQLRVLEEAAGLLPAGVTKLYLRSDTAAYLRRADDRPASSASPANAAGLGRPRRSRDRRIGAGLVNDAGGRSPTTIARACSSRTRLDPRPWPKSARSAARFARAHELDAGSWKCGAVDAPAKMAGDPVARLSGLPQRPPPANPAPPRAKLMQPQPANRRTPKPQLPILGSFGLCRPDDKR